MYQNTQKKEEYKSFGDRMVEARNSVWKTNAKLLFLGIGVCACVKMAHSVMNSGK